MSLRLITVLTAALLFAPGCSKPTPAQLAEQERVTIREQKRQDAIKILKELAATFPDQPRGKEAAAEAAALEAAAPKK